MPAPHVTNVTTPLFLVTRNFPPVHGGMERLIYHVYRELRNEFEVAVLGPRGCENFVEPHSQVSSCRLTPTTAFLACLQWKAYRTARRLRPHLVLAGSGVAVPAALGAARSIGVPVIAYLHGLDLVVRSALYRSMFLPAIRRCDGIVVNSQNTAELAREAGIDDALITILHPGVLLPAPSKLVIEPTFRAKLGVRRKVILLSVGRILPRKGLAEFIEYVMPVLVSKGLDVMFVVIGTEPENALKSSYGTIQRVLAAITSTGMNERVVMMGAVDDSTLAQAYRESDLLIFPVRDIPGDVEGFGMVAVEAAAHGLPTVAFATGGVPDAVREGVSGYLVRAGDYACFAETILRHFETQARPLWEKKCIGFASEFSWEHFGERLRNICRRVITSSKQDDRRMN